MPDSLTHDVASLEFADALACSPTLYSNMAALQLRPVPAEVIGREEARAAGAHQMRGDAPTQGKF